MENNAGLLERIFHLKDSGTTAKTEIMAGITTFMTMAYILAVNPSIMSTTGMDKAAVLTATAIAGFMGTMLMAVFANYPFALAPGMGLNAFFAYTVIGQMGYSWQMALAAVFVEGIIFIILSLTSVREAIFNAIPMNLKRAVSAGIGVYICFIGLASAHVILIAKKVRGNILWGIVFTWVLGIICELTGVYVPDPSAGAFSTLPDLSNGLASFIPASMDPILFQLDFSQLATFNFVVVLLAFLFVDLFDTIGTLIGVSSKANMLDKNGKLPHIKGALMADAVATAGGALLGVSTTTTYVESAAGVSEGGRTGLTAVTVSILFLLSLFFSPFFMAIPAFATAPALVSVGFLMFTAVTGIDFDDPTEAFPCYLTIIAMPFTYSIAEGIAFGIISYTLINLLAGNRSKVSLLMIILTVLFVMKYIFI